MCHVTLTTRLSGKTYHQQAGTFYPNLHAKFELSNYTHYKDMKSGNNVEIGVVWGS